jgi:hypothetical protein
MAVARVLGRDELGGIEFENDDGTTFYTFGEDADSLAATLPAAPPPEAADMRTADAGGFIQAAREQRATDAAASERSAADAPAGVAGDIRDLAAQAYAGQVYGTGQAQQQPQEAAEPQEPIEPQTDPFLDSINAPVSVPYSPGVGREQLAARSSQGVPVPTTYTERTEGAVPIVPEIEQRQADLYDQQEELARWQYQGRVAGARAAAAEAQADNDYWQNQAYQRRAEMNRAQRIAEERFAAVQQKDAEIAAHKEDPTRFFSERGPWVTIAAAVMMGLGEYAAILGGTGKNTAKDLIMQAVHADVAAQRQDYLTKKDARKSLFGQYMESLGDLDAASEATAYSQKGIAQAYAQQMAALSGAGQADGEWAKMLMELEQQRVAHARKIVEQTTGKIVATTSSSVEYPRAASGGYQRAPTDRERATRAQSLASTQDAYRRYHGIPDPQKVGEAEAVARAKVGVKQTQDVRAAAEKYGKELGSNIVGAETSLRRVEELIPPEGEDIPASGITAPIYKGGWAAQPLQTEAGQKLHAALIDLEEKRIMMLTGAAAPEQQMKRIKESIRGLSDRQLRGNIGRVKLEIEAQKRNARATYGPEAVDLYEGRAEAAVKREREAVQEAAKKNKGER